MDEQYSFLGNQAKTQNWASVLRSAQTCTLEGIWKLYYFLGLFFLAIFVWFLCCHILASTEVLRFHELKISCKPVNSSFQPVSAEKLEKSCLSIRIFNAYVRSFWILWVLLSRLTLIPSSLSGTEETVRGMSHQLKNSRSALPLPAFPIAGWMLPLLLPVYVFVEIPTPIALRTSALFSISQC